MTEFTQDELYTLMHDHEHDSNAIAAALREPREKAPHASSFGPDTSRLRATQLTATDEPEPPRGLTAKAIVLGLLGVAVGVGIGVGISFLPILGTAALLTGIIGGGVLAVGLGSWGLALGRDGASLARNDLPAGSRDTAKESPERFDTPYKTKALTIAGQLAESAAADAIDRFFRDCGWTYAGETRGLPTDYEPPTKERLGQLLGDAYLREPLKTRASIKNICTTLHVPDPTVRSPTPGRQL